MWRVRNSLARTVAVMFLVSCGSEIDFQRVGASFPEKNRVVEFLLALRDSLTVSLRVPSGHHVEVGARRLPITLPLFQGSYCPRG